VHGEVGRALEDLIPDARGRGSHWAILLLNDSCCIIEELVRMIEQRCIVLEGGTASAIPEVQV
jgi:hypothetical protein